MGCPRWTAAPVRRLENAELVALWIGEHDPRLLALANICPLGAHGHEALELSGLAVWAEVEVQTILAEQSAPGREDSR